MSRWDVVVACAAEVCFAIGEAAGAAAAVGTRLGGSVAGLSLRVHDGTTRDAMSIPTTVTRIRM
jgi:hypothetical protein